MTVCSITFSGPSFRSPRAFVRPYSTRLLPASLVCHTTVAPLCVVATTPGPDRIFGATVSGVARVVTVRSWLAVSPVVSRFRSHTTTLK